MASETEFSTGAIYWCEPDNLMLLECWARDGYTMQDICNRIGINLCTLRQWRIKHPEIDKAIRNGKEIVDYKVENALLKSALGYRTKEVKVITTIRKGEVVETTKEVTEKDQAPNVSACQCWLYNRMPDKWKKNRDNQFDLGKDEEIKVTITRAGTKEITNDEDAEWNDEVNESVELRTLSNEEIERSKKQKKMAQKQQDAAQKVTTKVEIESEDDLDYWPEDWEDEGE